MGVLADLNRGDGNPGTGALFTVEDGIARGARAGVVAAVGAHSASCLIWSSRSRGLRR